MTTLVPVDFNPFGTTPDDFVEKFRPAADLAAERLGVSPKVLLAQFGHETGWGKHIIPGTNNLGNIKDFSGKGVSATDSMLGTKDKYRVYGSPEEFAEDFANLITKRYGAAVGAGEDPVKFARALKDGGYAEDPAYISKVVGAHRAISKPAALVPVDFNPFESEAKFARESVPVAGDDIDRELAKASANNRRESMHPAIRGIIDFAHGATGASRGAMNLLNKVAPSQFPQQEPSALVTPGFSGAKLAGSLADPAAIGIGGAAMRALPYAPVLGSGVASGARAVAQNLAGGAVPGAALGALNAAAEGGNAASGAGTGAAIGAAANMVIPPVLQGMGVAGAKVVDWLRGKYGDVVAKRILEQAAPNDLQAIATMAKNADPGLTAAQATAGSKNRVIAALGEYAGKVDPLDKQGVNLARQAQERIDDIAKVAGGNTQTSSLTTQGMDRKALLIASDGMIAKELDAVNRGTIKPLDLAKFEDAITSRMSKPGGRLNEYQEAALGYVKERLEKAKNLNNGIVDAYDLYEIRKTAINFAIEKMSTNPAAQAKQSSKLLGEVRPLIDQAIEEAGGTGWRKYLDTFSNHMRRIERKEMGAVMLGQLKDSPQDFVRTARGDNPAAVRDVFGTEFNINAAMGSKMPPVTKAAEELARDAALRESAASGRELMNIALKDNVSKFRLPHRLDRGVIYVNRALTEIEDRIGKSARDSLVKAMESGKTLADAINFIPLQNRVKVIKVLNDSPYLKAAALNQATQQ